MSDHADRDELLRLLTEKARAGSVYACSILLAELRRDGTSPVGSEEGWAEIYGDDFAELDAHSNIAPLRRPPS
jgi:hypothetical protein